MTVARPQWLILDDNLPDDLRHMEALVSQGVDPEDIPEFERLLIHRIQRDKGYPPSKKSIFKKWLELDPDFGKDSPLTAKETMENIKKSAETKNRRAD